MRESLADFWQTYCQCSLKTIAFVAGWIGVCYRGSAAVALAVIISKLTKYDPNIYPVLFSMLLTYCFFSLAADFLLIIGVSQEKPYYMLPYLSLNGIELFTGLIGLIGGSVVLASMEMRSTLAYYIPTAILVLVINACLWLCLVRLFKQLEKNLALALEKSSNTSNTIQFNLFRWHLGFGRSDSLDIAP